MDIATILLIDDDVQLVALLKELLESRGHEVDVAYDGADGAEKALRNTYQLIILDLMMPVKDGFEVLREIRVSSDTPIIILTARDDNEDLIEGFEGGADDYLSKPFNPPELLLRAQAILRRTDGSKGQSNMIVGPLNFDLSRQQATVGNRQVRLTGAEGRVLEALMRSPGKVQSRKHLTEFALGRSITSYDRALDTHISHLRRKLGRDNQHQTPIRSVRGTGYFLVPDWEPGELP
jgi:two-component system response regulator CpxR